MCIPNAWIQLCSCCSPKDSPLKSLTQTTDIYKIKKLSFDKSFVICYYKAELI
jgi:hypothetical protein